METLIFLLVLILVLIVLFVCWRVYIQYRWGYCVSSDSLAGKVCVVTGATGGLGRHTVKGLCSRGATVVLASRDMEKANRLIETLRKNKKKYTGEMIAMPLDLASLVSIRKFAERLCVAFRKVDILINNAGVAVPNHMHLKTKEGYEVNMGVNHLGHFLLTNLLLRQLEAGAPSRVVIVSSSLYEQGKINFQDLNLEETKTTSSFKDDPAYVNSKLMNVYFGKALAERTSGKGIQVFILCPGFSYTNLFRHTLKWYHFLLLWPIFVFVMRSPRQGAQTILHCATDPTLQGKSGSFFANCKERELEIKYDKSVEERLWAESEAMVNGQMA